MSRLLIVAALAASTALPLTGTGAQAGVFGSISKSASRVALNPQPLPPKELRSPFQNRILLERFRRGGLASLNPQPLPPGPPPPDLRFLRR